MRKFLLSFAVCVLFASCALAADIVRIGHTASLTGGASMWGQSEANAIDMLVKKINAQGGVLGKQIEIVRYDNRNDAVEAVNVAKRLVADGVVAVIGPAQSGRSIASIPVFERAKIPMIVTTATNPFVTIDQKTDKLREYAFRPCFIDPYQGTVAARFAADDLKAKSAGILYDVGDDYGQWLSRYFEEAFAEKGGKVVAKEAFRTEELDYRAQLGKMKEQNPDVIFVPTSQKEAAMAAKQARDLGIKAVLLGTDNWGSPDLIDLGGDAVNGAYFVNLADLDDPDIQTFVKEYKETFGVDPVLPNPVMAQDALIMIVEAAKVANSFDGEKLSVALANLKDINVTSGKLTMDPTNHNPLDKPAVIQQVDVANKKFVFVKKYEEKKAMNHVPGDFMVVFKAGKDTLEVQSAYLVKRYGVEIKGAFPEISRTSGKGMFHIHSAKAAASEAEFDKLMRELQADPQIESVSLNRIMKLIQ